jgi:hypothetical protein
VILFEKRASGILYNLLRTLPGTRPFLLPANVCPAVPLTFRKAGRDFRVIDIDGQDLGLDRRRCLEAVREQPDAWEGVIYVRPYGAVTEDVDDFFQALKGLRPDLLIVDDRCLCVPDCDGADLAPDADVTLFSTGRTKLVDLSFGGFAHCRDGIPYRRWESSYSDVALVEVTLRYKKALAQRTFCTSGKENWLQLSPPDVAWQSYRSAVEDALPRAAAHRRELNAIYNTLPVEIRLPDRFQHWRFHILVPEPDRVVEALFAAGLFASRHYASLGGVFCAERFPEAEWIHQRIVNLFNDRYFDPAQAARAVEVVSSLL